MICPSSGLSPNGRLWPNGRLRSYAPYTPDHPDDGCNEERLRMRNALEQRADRILEQADEARDRQTEVLNAAFEGGKPYDDAASDAFDNCLDCKDPKARKQYVRTVLMPTYERRKKYYRETVGRELQVQERLIQETILPAFDEAARLDQLGWAVMTEMSCEEVRKTAQQLAEPSSGSEGRPHSGEDTPLDQTAEDVVRLADAAGNKSADKALDGIEKKLFENRPEFSDPSARTAQEIADTLEQAKVANAVMVFGPIINWMTSTTPELAAQREPNPVPIINAIRALPDVTRNRVRHHVDTLLLNEARQQIAGKKGELSADEEKWWKDFRTLL